MTPFIDDGDIRLYVGDALEVLRGLPDGCADACVTSPPYLDARPEYPSPTLQEFAAIFGEVARVVNGPVLLNAGRIFRGGCEVRWQEPLLAAAEEAGLPHLDTRVWIKPNANPIRGNLFVDSHEYVYVLGRDAGALNIDAIRRPHADSTVARFGRAWVNHRGVKAPRESRARKIRAVPNPLGARPRSYMEHFVGKDKGNPHPAPMAEDVAAELVVLASAPGGTILDPFSGSGTTGLVARKHGRRALLIELNADYAAMAARRLSQLSLLGGAA